MAALSYNGRFVEYVEAGLKYPADVDVMEVDERIKRQTVRNFRKYPIKEGETLHHFYAMRTKHCKKLGTSICKSVHRIVIRKNSITIYNPSPKIKWERIFQKKMLDQFAVADGFSSWYEMTKWWVITHGAKCFPFTGQLIKW